MGKMKEVSISDTTLRDGLQHEEHYMSLAHRVDIVNALIDSGIKKIEVGSFSHPLYLPQFREIDDFTMMLPENEDVEYGFLALNKRAVERVIELKKRGARIDRVLCAQIATSESYAKKNMNRTIEELFDEAKISVKMLHDNGIRHVVANVGTIFGCPLEGEMPLEKAYDFVERLLDMGYDEIEHSDPDGAATPEKIGEYCSEVMRRWPDPGIHLMHIHDIHGMGIACYYAALEQGIVNFECSLGCVGGQPANRMDGIPVKGTGDYYFTRGRTGLVSTEDFAGMLCRMGYCPEVDMDKLIKAGCLAEKYIGRHLDSVMVSDVRG